VSFNREAYDEAIARRDLARTDLDELAQQVEDGEIDEETASGLRSGYETELAAAEADLAKLGTPPSVKKPRVEKPSTKRAPSERDQQPKTGFNSRWLVGAGILIVALVMIIISVQNSSEPESVAGGDFPGTGSATDPCAEMADAVDQHPGNALRLALADCYTESGNAMAALEHFRTVVDSTEATPVEVGRANVGLGYLNLQIGELTNAAEYMRSALAADATNIEANYFMGMMLVYDLGDPAGGVPYLETALAAPGLPESVVQEIETALAVAQGEGGS
jgi:tetratricopeptide (TPR) repeat protein